MRYILCFLLSLVFFLPTAVRAEVSARACIVTEANSGRVLYQKNPDTPLPMASTTKIMTALVALENLDKSAPVTVSSSAAGVEGSSMYLQEGEILTLEELLYGLMLSSGNDAAVAIAEQLGGIPSFVEKMNQKAETLGLSNTRFQNPNGLPQEGHHSSARDMASLTAAALENPDFARIVATKTKTIEGEGKAHARALTNHNKLLRMYEGCIGVKTGFTKAAGRCLVSAAEKEGMTLICVTLNAPDDWSDHITLYHSLFSAYQPESPQLQGEIPLVHANQTALPYTLGADFSYPVKEGETLTLLPDPIDRLSAPVSPGDPCGTARVFLDGKEIAALPLVVTEGAKQVLIPQTVKEEFTLTLGTLCRRWLTLLCTG